MTARLAWLVGNFAANAALLYGAAGYFADGGRLPLLVAGALATLTCILTLSRPTPPDREC